MKSRINRALSAAMLSSIACSAMAANENIDIKVIGEIVPAACIPAVTGGGVFDYGSMSAKKIAMDDYTVLDKLTQNFTITCSAPVKVGLRFTDARQATAIIPKGKLLLYRNPADSTSMGLGEAGGKKIGAYLILLDDIKLDDKILPDNIFSTDMSNMPWLGFPYGNGTLFFNRAGRIYSWSESGSSYPVAFKTLRANLNVQAAINKGSELDLSQKVTLDGLANIEVVYL